MSLILIYSVDSESCTLGSASLWQVKLQFWYQLVAQLCLLPRSCMKIQEIGISTDKTNWAIQDVDIQNDSNDVQKVLILHQKLAH